MKCQSLILLAMVCFAAICRSQTTNSFGIYLTAEPVDGNHLDYRKMDWLHVKLETTPVISEADILAYDLTNHWLTLNAEVFKRLPAPPVWGRPFVVVADGERVYLGAFMTPASSIPAPVPSILLWRSPSRTNLPPDTLQIDRAYPTPSFGVGPDPRSDERIKRTLAALHKTK
jgi:hypothetical protein